MIFLSDPLLGQLLPVLAIVLRHLSSILMFRRCVEEA